MTQPLIGSMIAFAIIVSPQTTSADNIAVYAGAGLDVIFKWCLKFEPTELGVEVWKEAIEARDGGGYPASVARIGETLENNRVRSLMFKHNLDGHAALDDFCDGSMRRGEKYIRLRK